VWGGPRRRKVHELAACLFLGCSAEPPGRAELSGSAEPGASVVVSINGGAPSAMTLGVLKTRRALTELLPPEMRDASSWTLLSARSRSGASLHVPDPGARFTHHEVAFYEIEGLRPGLGVFRTPPAGAKGAQNDRYSAPIVFVAAVDEVSVWTTAPPEEGPAESDLVLEVEVDGATTPVSRATLSGISRHTPASGGRDVPGLSRREVKQRSKAGWRVEQLLPPELVLDDRSHVVVHTKAGETQTLTPADLHASEPPFLVVFNQKGSAILQPTLRAPAEATRLRHVNRLVVSSTP